MRVYVSNPSGASGKITMIQVDIDLLSLRPPSLLFVYIQHRRFIFYLKKLQLSLRHARSEIKK